MAHPADQKIRIVVIARPGVVRDRLHAFLHSVRHGPQARVAVELIPDVVAYAPHGPYAVGPQPGLAPAVLAEVEEDLSSRRPKRGSHLRIFPDEVALRIAFRRMIIVFEVIEAPIRDLLRVAELVPQSPRIPMPSGHAAAQIDPGLEAQGVQPARQKSHSVRELVFPRHKLAFVIALLFQPAVVDVDVLIARLQISVVRHTPRDLENVLLRRIAIHRAVRIPAHGRRRLAHRRVVIKLIYVHRVLLFQGLLLFYFFFVAAF